MLAIDVDAKYNSRPVRFYGSQISAAVIAMSAPRSGMPKNSWIVEVYHV